MPSGDFLILAILSIGPASIFLGLLLLVVKRKERGTSLVRVAAILAILFGLLFTAGLLWIIHMFFSKPTGSFDR